MGRQSQFPSVWHVVKDESIKTEIFEPVRSWVEALNLPVKFLRFNRMTAHSHIPSHIDPTPLVKILVPIIASYGAPSWFEYHKRIWKTEPTGEIYYNFPGLPYIIDSGVPHSVTTTAGERNLFWIVFEEGVTKEEVLKILWSRLSAQKRIEMLATENQGKRCPYLFSYLIGSKKTEQNSVVKYIEEPICLDAISSCLEEHNLAFVFDPDKNPEISLKQPAEMHLGDQTIYIYEGLPVFLPRGSVITSIDHLPPRSRLELHKFNLKA